MLFPMKEAITRAIAISGEAGSGKTTLARKIGGIFNFEVFGAGELFRIWCSDHGIDDLRAESGSNEVHNGIDEIMLQKMVLGKAVVEGRVAGLVAMVNELPGVMKVLLVCDAEKRYRRIFVRDKGKYQNIAEVRQITEEREDSNMKIFSERYGLSYRDINGYNLVVDTGDNNLAQSVNLVIKAVKS